MHLHLGISKQLITCIYDKKAILFLICCVSTLISFGQSTVKGKIVDSIDNEPVIGSVIRIKDASAATVSGLDGSFILKTNETGDKKIAISNMIGYASKEVDVQTKGDAIDMGKINLETEAIGLKEVTVVASVAIEKENSCSHINYQTRYN